MSTQSRADRIFIKDALPRLYAQVHETLSCNWPELLEQLRLLYLVRRCKCGLDGCVSFICESADARFAPINCRRPLSYSLDDIHGWYSVSDDGVLSGFEILNDYDDGYLNSHLIEAGFGFNAPSTNAITEEPSEGTGSDGKEPSRHLARGSEAQEQQASDHSVYMTPAATRHLIEYRLGVQAYSTEEVVNFTETAMAASASPEVTAAENARYVSLLSVAVLDQAERKFKSRMPLNKVDGGFEVCTVVPEGIFKSPAKL